MKPFEISRYSKSSSAEKSQAGKPVNLSEHLANERTYLAYLRTAISLISFGITINRFSLFLIQSHNVPERALARWHLAGVGKLGFGMVVFGLVLMVWAGIHFSRVLESINRGDYHPSHAEIWLITAGVLLAGGIALFWLFPH